MASGPLECAAMDILADLLKRLNGNQVVPMITECFKRLRRAVLTLGSTMPSMALLFRDKWIVLYEIQTQLMSGNGTWFVSKFFESMFAFENESCNDDSVSIADKWYCK